MWFRLLIISLWTCSSLTSSKSSTTSKEEENLIKSHHRQKRFLWMTQEKRLVLPPGTQLVLTPTLAMPLLRYPPSGLDANLTISTPFTRNDFSFIHKNCSWLNFQASKLNKWPGKMSFRFNFWAFKKNTEIRANF